MISLLLRLVFNAIALWVSTLLVTGITISDASGATSTQSTVVTLLVVALIFTLVNAIVKPIVSFLSLPLTILTLGLFALVVNALMLMLTDWISSKTDFALHVDGFWTAVLGGLIVAVVNWVLDLFVARDRD